MESKVIPLRPTAVGTGFALVAGMDSVTHRLRSTVITPLRVAAMGDPAVTPPTGLVMYGPPGCGKHHIAEALAAELDADLVVSTADRLGEEPLTRPSIVVLEEAPSVAEIPLIEGWFDHPDPACMLTVLLSERPSALHTAVLERGRFDRMVLVPPPDFAARRMYVLDALGPGVLDDDSVDEVVALLEGHSGDDVRAVIASAERLAGDAPLTIDSVVEASAITPSTVRGWLDDARSLLAMTATRGMVDDLSAYLRRNRLI